MNAYKDFHAFTCISIIKTCVADSVLKIKTQTLKLFLQKAGQFLMYPITDTQLKTLYTYSNENECM